MPKISVIIPCFNSEKYIAETLDSVLAQTFSDWQAICVNDGSTDKTREILEKYVKKDGRIKVFTQKNQGVVVARNNAAEKAQGDYLFFLDSDDLIEKTMLEKTYNAIIKSKSDIITTRAKMFDVKNDELKLFRPTKRNMAFCNCLTNSALLKKSLFEKSGGYDENFDKGLEDYDFWLNLIYKQNAKIYRVPEILFYYRIKSKKESRNVRQLEKYNRKLLNKLENKYHEIERYKKLVKFENFFFQIRKKQNKTYIRVLRLPVFSIKTWNNSKIYRLFNLIPILKITR